MSAPVAAQDLVVATDASQDEEQRAALAHGVEPTEDPSAEYGERDTLFTAAAGAGVRGSLGRVYTRGVDPGWYGRLELAAYSASAFEGAGAIGGALIGGEFWSAPGATGGGLPMGFYLGARSPHVMSTLGGGFQMFIVDDVDDDAGFGVYVPTRRSPWGSRPPTCAFWLRGAPSSAGSGAPTTVGSYRLA